MRKHSRSKAITRSSNVFVSPECTNLQFKKNSCFKKIFIWAILISIENFCFVEKQNTGNFASKNLYSGFVKTCDEHILEYSK